MKSMKQIAILCGIGMGLAGAGAFGGATLAKSGVANLADEKTQHPKMRLAITSLEEGRKHLEQADHDFGGHRVKAIEHTNMALDEIYAALGEKAPAHKAEK